MAGFSEIAENSENIHRHCALCPRPVLKIDELLRGSLGMALYRQQTNEQSELGLEYREYTRDMGVRLSLLNNS